MYKAFCFSIFFAISITVSAQWIHVNPGTTNWISDVSFPTDQSGYASDDHTGKIWHTTNGGSSWNLLNNNLFIGKMVFLTPDTGLAITDSGLAITIDAGAIWNVVLNPTNITWWTRPIFFGQTGITVQSNSSGDSAFVYKSNDGGFSWFLFSGNALFTGAYVGDISFPDSMTGYITGETDLYKTSDGGATWTLLQSRYPAFGSLSFVSADTGFLYVDLGDFFRTYDGGQTFDSFPIPVTPINGQIRFLNSSLGYICGGDGFSSGFVAKSTNGGTSWTLDHSDNNTLLAFSFPSLNTGYACGNGGSVIKSFLTDDIKNSEGIIPVMTVSPNPFSSYITLKLNQEFNGTIDFKCSNSLGQVIFQKIIYRNEDNIDLNMIPPGIYTVSVQTEKLLRTTKVVKYR